MDHGAVGTCVDGAVGVIISASPSALAAGERSTLDATVSGADGGTLPSFSVGWSVADTSIATIVGPDENQRYFATARKAGTTEVTGRCGALAAVATITVTGESSAPPDTAGAPATVFVALNAPSLQTGQSTQAVVSGVDAGGLHMTIVGTAWSSSNTAVATITSSGLVTAVAPGEANITAAVKGTVGSAALAVGGATTAGPPAIDPPTNVGLTAVQPELPRAGVPDARFVEPTGRIIRVPIGGGVQEALDAALPGDEVVLTAGTSHFGNFILPDNGGGVGGICTTWTTLTSDGAIPSEGARATPEIAASAFARLLTPSVEPALRTAPRASCWRVVGVEMTVAPTFTGLQYGLVALGNGDASSIDAQSHGIVLDRVYIHGQSTTSLMRCLALNSGRSAVINSWISDCHAKGLDSQAIAGWNGPGPYLIENNFLAGATENILFGGADPGIAGLSPSDITIRRNHVYKDPAWKGVWLVKNLFELKNARRVLVEGNVFENNWADGQSGMAIVVKSQTGNEVGGALSQGSQDLTFRYNIVRNSPRGLNLQAVGEGGSDYHVARVRAEHNLFENIGTFNGTGDDGWLVLLTHDLRDIAIVHNTFVGNLPNAGIDVFMDYSGGGARRIQFDDNVFAGQSYYALFTAGASRVGTESLNAFAPASWSFNRNVVASVGTDFVSWHPSGSFYPRLISDIGFAAAESGDYRLGSGSPYRGKATDGSDPGPDFAGLSQRTAGVVMR